VAVLDDHRLVAEGIAALLAADRGLDVAIVAASWAELVEHSAGPVDVAVIDLHLGDGILLATRVRALANMGTSSVVVGRHLDARSVASAMRAGALAFVAKRDSVEELVAAIRTAATGNKHLSDAQAHAIALAETGPAVDPGLGRQEERALVLYAGGHSMREVADIMATTEETAKSYVKRARRKFREVGINLGTRLLLRRYAAREGWHNAGS
jgi:DNA-binding NarL/FixJ family response regulator